MSIGVFGSTGGQSMIPRFSIFAALAVFAASPANAQHEAIMKTIEVPGADFDLVLAIPKMSDGHVINLVELRGDIDPSVLYLAGGRLVHAFDTGVGKMFKDISALQHPSCTFAPKPDVHPQAPVAVYVVPKQAGAAKAR
jgi:hypothetical protein